MEEPKETLKLLNPWWKDNSVSRELAKPYKRKMFGGVLKLVGYRQIVMLSGLRRVGKTTLLYQVIENLLKNTDPKHIIYFNFDRKTEEITEILNAYGELTDIDWKKGKIFVFFDEIAKLDDWANKIKLIYDAFPNIKFFVSSSSSIGLEEQAVKNLAGRYFLANVLPLNFSEYLELRNSGKILDNPELWKNEIEKEFKKYLIRTFPETVRWDDESRIREYMRTTIIDKIVKYDLPEKFRNVDRNLISGLLEIFYSEPGMYLDYDSISQKLRISKKTLAKHMFYLEFSYLIRRVKNYRVGSLTSSKKLQKIYPYWWSLAYCYGDDYDKIMENVVASYANLFHYWRKGGKEIDFIDIDEHKVIMPIEVKNKTEADKHDIKNIKYFLGKYNLRKAVLLYNGRHEEIRINEKTVILMPLWEWLLLKEDLDKLPATRRRKKKEKK